MIYAFTDDSPLYELGVFVLLFLFCYLVASPMSVRQRLQRFLGWLAGALRGRGLFTAVTLDVEERRLNLLRVVLGVLMSGRAAANLHLAVACADPTIIVVASFEMGLCLLLLMGLATPVTAAVLAVTVNPILDNFKFTSNLGSMVAAMCCLIVALTPGGTRFSLDACLLRGHGRVARALQGLYGWWGMPTLGRATIAKFLALLGYAAVCAYASLDHVRYPEWRSGLVNAWAFLSPSVDPAWHGVADWVYWASPYFYVNFCRFSVYGMLVWEFGLLPLVLLGRLPRLAAILWGISFFLLSFLVLQFRYLAVMELLFWCVLFWNRWRLDREACGGLALCYDDRCASSRRWARVIRAIDLFDIVDVRPMSTNLEMVWECRVWPGSGLGSLFAVDAEGRVYQGTALGKALAGRILLLALLTPVLLLAWPFLRRTRVERAAITCAARISTPRLTQRLAHVLQRTEDRGGYKSSGEVGDVFSSRHRARARAATGEPSTWEAPAATATAVLTGPPHEGAESWRTPSHDEPSSVALRRWRHPAAPSARRVGPVFAAFVLSFVVMLGVYMVRLPYVSDLRGIAPIASATRSLFGRSPLVFGMGPVTVFDPWQLNILHRHAILVNWVHGDKGAISEDVCFLGNQYFGNIFIGSNIFNIAQIGVPDWLTSLIRRYGCLNREDGTTTPHITYFIDAWPTREDFLKYRYVPVRKCVICRMTLDEEELTPTHVEFQQEGVDAVLRKTGLPIRLDAAHVHLLHAFPVQAEARRIAHWFDRPHLVHRPEETLPALQQMLEECQYKDRLTNLIEVQHVLAHLDLDWSPLHKPHPGGGWKADLDLARTYYEIVFDDELRRETQADYEAAVRAAARNDTVTCLLHTAEVRRAYFRALGLTLWPLQ